MPLFTSSCLPAIAAHSEHLGYNLQELLLLLLLLRILCVLYTCCFLFAVNAIAAVGILTVTFMLRRTDRFRLHNIHTHTHTPSHIAEFVISAASCFFTVIHFLLVPRHLPAEKNEGSLCASKLLNSLHSPLLTFKWHSLKACQTANWKLRSRNGSCSTHWLTRIATSQLCLFNAAINFIESLQLFSTNNLSLSSNY